MSHRMILGVLVLAALAAASVRAAEDSAGVKTHIDAARKLAGNQWTASIETFCSTTQQIADRRAAGPANATNAVVPVVAPMKVFDNVYLIGQKPILTWAITTPEGIILIDSGTRDLVEDVLIAGMKKAGLNPADVRYVMITHEHVEHIGGAKYLQEHYPSLHIAMSGIGWDSMKQPTLPLQPQDVPKRDVVLKEGMPLTLGGESITPVATPGHADGGLGFIFPVKDNGQPHVAALFGSPVIIPAPAVPMEQYQHAIDHWSEWTRKMNVDVELENHPLFRAVLERLTMLKTRKAAQPNPLVVGPAAYQTTVEALNECAKAQLAMRAAK